MALNELVPDGERYLPEFKGVIRLEHYHRYYAAASLCSGKEVLDIASGEGFGSSLLARYAQRVVGVDISEVAVRHAARTYVAKNLEFRVGSATQIPLEDGSVDVIVSFETIEHLAEHEEMLLELRRVLRPNGLLFLSSPNKAEYSDKPGYNNPFHVRELYTADLMALMGRHFKNLQHYGQRVTAASVIASENAQGAFRNYRHQASESAIIDAMYDIVLASDGPLPGLENSIFEEMDSPLQPLAVEKAIREAEQQISQCSDLEMEVERLKVTIEDLNQLVQAKDAARAHCVVALRSVIMDANKVLQDKWWRRTKLFRRASNSIRKIKGKPTKHFPKSFAEDVYLSKQDGYEKSNTIRSTPHGAAVSALRPKFTAMDPVSGHKYPSDIDAISFSDISEDRVPYEPYNPVETRPRTIAFYLPQFHPFPENDKWWGKGFTEWTNVGKAKPLFYDHYQPHCPIHLGYYDLRVPSVMEEQARIARAYGVNGFAYYFYWFAGKLLMEHPLEAMLANPKVDMPFCFIWANENWTRRWDGQENDVLIAQEHSLDDSRALLNYVRKFFDDPRYITIDGKPVFVVYRPGIIPDIAKTLDMWRQEAKAMGFPGIYLVSAQAFGHRDPREFGFDAAMEFPPHTTFSEEVSQNLLDLDPDFSGHIFDYDQVVANAVTVPPTEYKVFPTATLSWDNTARKSICAHVFTNFSVTRYSQWLAANAERVSKDKRLSADEKLVFVNAWNEWAEGTHLEPDQKHGFGYLEATRRVMAQYGPDAGPFLDPQVPKKRMANLAVILHLHFSELWHELAEAIRSMGEGVTDIYATATSVEAANLIVASFPNAYVELVDNRGRDIRPFLHIFGKIHAMGYVGICKVHGKKSSYRDDGDTLRKSAYDAILTSEAISRLKADPQIGLLVPTASLIPHTEKNMTYNRALTEEIAKSLGLRFIFGHFPAGSMFWFRPEALKPLLKVATYEFDVERGLVDGTRAHAVERLFANICEAQGYSVSTITGGPVAD